MAPRDTDLQACCVGLYGHPLARWLLGDSMHPAGLALTGKLARLLTLDNEASVLDVGSGHGATAVHLAGSFGCRVLGVTLEAEGVAAGRELARQHGVEGQVSLRHGDFMQAPLPEESFDAVVMECVLSILADKEAALRRCHALLRPGGRLGLTDVTVSGLLPPELDGLLSLAGCVGGAKSLDQYRQIVEAAALVVDYCQDLPEVASAFLRQTSGKLLVAEAAAGLGKLPVDKEALREAKRLLSLARDAVEAGVLGYGLVVAHRSETRTLR